MNDWSLISVHWPTAMRLHLIYASEHCSAKTKLWSKWPPQALPSPPIPCRLAVWTREALCWHRTCHLGDQLWMGPFSQKYGRWGGGGGGRYLFDNVLTLAFKTLLFLNHAGPWTKFFLILPNSAQWLETICTCSSWQWIVSHCTHFSHNSAFYCNHTS